jgi:hypothetical protein
LTVTSLCVMSLHSSISFTEHSDECSCLSFTVEKSRRRRLRISAHLDDVDDEEET